MQVKEVPMNYRVVEFTSDSKYVAISNHIGLDEACIFAEMMRSRTRGKFSVQRKVRYSWVETPST